MLYTASKKAARSIQKIPSLNENTPSHKVSTIIPEKEIKMEIQQYKFIFSFKKITDNTEVKIGVHANNILEVAELNVLTPLLKVIIWKAIPTPPARKNIGKSFNFGNFIFFTTINITNIKNANEYLKTAKVVES